MYLQFLASLYSDKTRIVDILTLVTQGFDYST